MVLVPATHLPLVRSAEYESADVYGVEFSERKVSVVDYRHGEDVVWLWHEVVYWYIQKKIANLRENLKLAISMKPLTF